MRTNIDLDDDLMAEAMRRSGHKTKKATVEAALRLIIQMDAQTKIRQLRGKVKWEGDLEESRTNKDRNFGALGWNQ